MIDTTEVEAQLAAAKTFADHVGMREQLEQQLAYLDQYAEHGDRGKTQCALYPDGAPYSFGFTMKLRTKDGGYRNWFNGGLLFHGPHDGNGSGAAPTYAVCMQPTVGWSIHT